MAIPPLLETVVPEQVVIMGGILTTYFQTSEKEQQSHNPVHDQQVDAKTESRFRFHQILF